MGAAVDFSPILEEIQNKLLENASGVSAYREDYTPRDLGSARDTGFIAWSFSQDYHVECSRFLTGTLEGDLDVLVFARTRTTRSTLHTDILDLWLPRQHGLRTSLGPGPLGKVYLHFVSLEDIREVFMEKTGHQTTETPGILTTFRIKLSM